MSYRIPQPDANYGGRSVAHAEHRVRLQGVPPRTPCKQPCLSSKQGWQRRSLSALHKLRSRRPGAASCAQQEDSSRTDRATDSES
jgi:hypothetical protein